MFQTVGVFCGQHLAQTQRDDDLKYRFAFAIRGDFSPAKWPSTCTGAVDLISERLPAYMRGAILGMARSEIKRFHHGWGTSIRNTFGMWRGNNALLKSCAEMGSTSVDPDAASMVILYELWTRLQGKEVLPDL